jgi:hypothetical protein
MAMSISSANGALRLLQDHSARLPRLLAVCLVPKKIFWSLAAPTSASVGILQSSLKIAQLLNFHCATKLTKPGRCGLIVEELYNYNIVTNVLNWQSSNLHCLNLQNHCGVVGKLAITPFPSWTRRRHYYSIRISPSIFTNLSSRQTER